MSLKWQELDFDETAGPVKLYLEDITTLADVMSAFDEPVHIVADGGTTTDPDDLRELDRIHFLTIEVPGRGLRVAIDRKSARVTAPAGDRHCRAVAAQLVLFLRARRRRVVAAFVRPRVGVPASVVLLTYVVIWTWWRDDLSDHHVWQAALAWIAAVGTVLSYNFIFFDERRVRIVPRSRRDAPPFWRRKRDDIAINAAFLVLGLWLGQLL